MNLKKRWEQLRHPWVLTVAFLSVIPLLPEYCAPLLAIASLVTACRDAHKNGRQITIGPLGKVMLLYLLYLAVGLLYSPRPFSALYVWLMWGVMLCGYVALHTVLIDRRRMDIALLGLSAAAGGVGGIACVQYAMRVVFGFTGHLQLWYPLDHILYRLSPININMEVVGDRACATFNNPNIMAEFLVMVIPFVTLFAFTGQHVRARLFSRACLLFAIAGVWFSFSRGSYLALLAMAAIWTIANIQRISLVFLAGFATLALTPTAVIERLFSINRVKDSVPPLPGTPPVGGGGGDKAISERLQVWLASWDNFLEHPLLGLGAGVGNTGNMLTAAGLKNVPHTHNIILQLLTEGGLIALSLFGVAGVFCLRTGIRLVRHNRKNARIGASVLAFTVGFCVIGMVDFPLFTPKLVGVFLLMLGLVDTAGRLGLKDSPSLLMETVTLSRFRFARKLK